MANPTSTTDPNRFVSVINTFKEDILNSVPGNLASVYLVPEVYASIQVAIDTAVLDGHDQYDPAVISVTPDSSTGTSVTDVQFTEDITLYDGIYLMSAVPQKRVNISGVLSFGSTALGTDLAGTADTTLWYLLRDIHFIANAGGTALVLANTAVVTRIDMIRVDLTNTGTAAGDDCFDITSTSVHTVNVEDSVWTSSGGAVADACLHIDGAAHVVTVRESNLSVTGTAEICAEVDDATLTFVECDLQGRFLCGIAAASAATLVMRDCVVTVAVSAAIAYIIGSDTGGLGLANAVTLRDTQFVSTDATITTVADGGGSDTLTVDNLRSVGASNAQLVPQLGFGTIAPLRTNVSSVRVATPAAAGITLTAADSGAIFLLQAGTTNPSLITCPAPAALYSGVYFDVVANIDLSAGTTEWRIVGTGATLDVSFVDSGGAAGLAAVGNTYLELAGNYSTSPAYVRVFCDGVSWHAKGQGLITGTTTG